MPYKREIGGLNPPRPTKEVNMNFDEMKAVITALEGQELPHHSYFDFQHDIIYLPWDKKEGEIAKALEAAGCHWDEDIECWAHF